MELTERFFGKGTPTPGGPPVANPRLQDGPAFAVLFPAAPRLQAEALTQALREYAPELATATAELSPAPANGPAPSNDPPPFLGLIGWDRHVVKLVGFSAPMPATVVRRCVQPAHYEPAIKEEAYDHHGHVLLFYAGYESDVLEQHVALAAVAGTLARFGGLVVVNETGGTSVPAAALLPHEEDAGDTLHALRTLPLPFLFVGFVKLEVEDVPGVWMRTYGCHVFGLPDLALHAGGHHQGSSTFHLFANMLAYLRETGRSFAPGDTAAVDDEVYLRFRSPRPDEWFLDSPGSLLVAEPVPPAEVHP